MITAIFILGVLFIAFGPARGIINCFGRGIGRMMLWLYIPHNGPHLCRKCGIPKRFMSFDHCNGWTVCELALEHWNRGNRGQYKNVILSWEE